MKFYCDNDPCEAEAVCYYVTNGGVVFSLCYACGEAFELGQANSGKLLHEIELLNFQLGTQIIYIPHHAHGDENHPDVEEGFITILEPQHHHAWCRFWSKHSPQELRTASTSEVVSLNFIKEKITRPQSTVTKMQIKLGYGSV
jgi:hypothetical protein